MPALSQGNRPALEMRLTRRHQLHSTATARRIHLADLAHDGVRHARRLDRLDRGVRVRRDADKRKLQHLRSEEHTSELQSRENLVCRLLLEKKKKKKHN